MNIDQLTELFKWMTIVNIGMYFLSTIMIVLMKRTLQKYHARLFNIREQNVTLIAYGYLGIYKVLLIVFNIVPYVALLIINQGS